MNKLSFNPQTLPFIKTDCICGLTYKALPKLDLFRQIIVPVWSLFYTKSCIDFITRNWITELGFLRASPLFA